jgi:hypothetical protein
VTGREERVAGLPVTVCLRGGVTLSPVLDPASYQVSLKMTLGIPLSISHAIEADEKFGMSSMSQCVSILANWYQSRFPSK